MIPGKISFSHNDIKITTLNLNEMSCETFFQ